MMINILTRFHRGREASMEALLKSLEGQEYRHIISVENKEDECFIRAMIPDAVIVRVQNKGGYSFNGYINEMAKVANGPVWVLDSDDIAEPNAIQTIKENYESGKLNIFRIFYGIDGCLPRSFHVEKKFEGLQISSQCMVWDPKSADFPLWSGVAYEADNYFKNDCKKKGIEISVHWAADYIGHLIQNNMGKQVSYEDVKSINEILTKTANQRRFAFNGISNSVRVGM